MPRKRGVHTPGPWEHWVGHNVVVAGPTTSNDARGIGGFRVHVASADDGEVRPDECLANARLIAASPDLLAACVALAKRTETAASCDWCIVESVVGSTSQPTHESACPVTMARDAIAKAVV